MKFFFIFILATFMFSFITTVSYAQNKTQAYYNQHESEILPDAQTAFKKGDYEQAIVLCRWHYIIVGDQSADILREKAENCRSLLKEINHLVDEGETDAAIEKALTLLALNPEDESAKILLLAVENKIIEEPIVEEIVFVTDSIITEELPENSFELLVEPNQEQKEPMLLEVSDTIQSISETPSFNYSNKLIDHLSIYGIKAGVSITDLTHFIKSDTKDMAQYLAYLGSLCVYNIGRSRLGIEAGALFGSSTSESISFNEIDAAVAFRVANYLFIKALGGRYSCKDNKGDSPATKGMGFGVGITSFLDKHFCMDIGLKYYPSSQESHSNTGNTNNLQHNQTTLITATPGGFSPYFCVGICF